MAGGIACVAGLSTPATQATGDTALVPEDIFFFDLRKLVRDSTVCRYFFIIPQIGYGKIIFWFDIK